MNICHVITRLIIGGAQENTVLTCKGLAERGHKVTLAAGPETGPEGSLWNEARDAGCEVVTVDSLRRAVHPLRDWQALRDLQRLFKRIAPDVVHTHSSKAGIIGRFAAAKAGVPVVIHTIHGMSFNRTQPLPTRMLYRQLERAAARRTTAFVTVADAMIDQAVAARLAPRERFHTIRSGLVTKHYAPNSELRARYRRKWDLADSDIVVGTVARLFVNKGYEQILAAMPDAVAREPRLKFVWIGDGAHRPLYKRELKRLGLSDRVRLIGLVSPDTVAEMINGFDMILHASRWEGLPRAIVQGLLTEVPAVSFDNDGAPEVVVTGETGLLIPYGNTPALADAVVQLASDSDLRKEMGKCGRARCIETFDWRKMVTDIESLCENLVMGRD